MTLMIFLVTGFKFRGWNLHNAGNEEGISIKTKYTYDNSIFNHYEWAQGNDTKFHKTNYL